MPELTIVTETCSSCGAHHELEEASRTTYDEGRVALEAHVRNEERPFYESVQTALDEATLLRLGANRRTPPPRTLPTARHLS